MQAQADVGSEINNDSLDAKLARIKAKAGDASARNQLAEYKKQMAARKAAQQAQAAGGAPKKTM
jgi:hypothetical protein